MTTPCRSLRNLLILLLLLAGAPQVMAQRFLIRAPAAAGTTAAVLIADVQAVGGDIIRVLDYSQYGYIAVAAFVQDAVGQQTLVNQGYVLNIDGRLIANSGTGSQGPPGWHLDCLVPGQPPATNPCAEPPVIYVVDTGIQSDHPDFQIPITTGKLEFLPGLSYGNVQVFPFPPVDPYTDVLDHGTRLAGLIAGQTTGLLKKLNAKVKIKSVNCYDVDVGANFPATWVSSCVAAIYGVMDDHYLRLETEPYYKNHASLMLFAHNTEGFSGREGDLDRAVDEARKAGIHVILSAGNQGTVPVLASAVSPAGMAFGYKIGTNPTVRFWWGIKPGAAAYQRIPASADGIFVVGSHTSANSRWTGTNTNAGAGNAVDFLAPGTGIYTTDAYGSYTTYTGTSYSAALAAATACYVVGNKPWAKPSQSKLAIQTSTVASATAGYTMLTIPPAASYASICAAYEDWTLHYDLTGPGALFTADPDFDGMANIQEYACGTDPRIPDVHFNAVITAYPSEGKVKFSLPLACYSCLPNPVTLHFEESTNLTSWTPLTYTLTPGSTKQGDGLVHTSNLVTSASVGRKFYRLRFTGSL